jgi:hypothetical protein
VQQRSRSIVLALLGALAVIAVPTAGAGAGAAPSVDFGLTLTGPANAKTKVGAPTTYTVTVTNAGPSTESPKMRFAGGSGAVDTGTGEPVKTISQTPSQGTCKNDGFGVTCRLADIAPGATATVPIVVEPLEDDVPTLDLQATTEPEKAAVVDTNTANDHAELDTEVPKPIKIEGVPNRCTSKKIVLRVRARVGTLAKQTKVEVDGNVLGSSTKNRLKVKIKEGELPTGNHRLTVIVQSSGPPLATFKDKFKTCEA